MNSAFESKRGGCLIIIELHEVLDLQQSTSSRKREMHTCIASTQAYHVTLSWVDKNGATHVRIAQCAGLAADAQIRNTLVNNNREQVKVRVKKLSQSNDRMTQKGGCHAVSE